MCNAIGIVTALAGAVVDVWRLVLSLVGRGWFLAAVAVVGLLLFLAAVGAVGAIRRELDELDKGR